MKHQNYGPHLGQLVQQLSEVITLAYDLHLAIIIPCFEDFKEEANKINKLGWYFSRLSIFPKNFF